MEQGITGMTRHVDALWPATSDLLEAGEAVTSLESVAGWTAVLAVLDREIELITREMDHAKVALSQADYALRHGRLGGLKAARLAALAIESKANDKITKLGGESPADGSA